MKLNRRTALLAALGAAGVALLGKDEHMPELSSDLADAGPRPGPARSGEDPRGLHEFYGSWEAVWQAHHDWLDLWATVTDPEELPT